MTEVLLGASVALNALLLYREVRRLVFRRRFKSRRPQRQAPQRRASGNRAA